MFRLQRLMCSQNSLPSNNFLTTSYKDSPYTSLIPFNKGILLRAGSQFYIKENWNNFCTTELVINCIISTFALFK
jgi:hypothetical protein